MKRYDEESFFKSAVQQMPVITPSTQLKDLIGPESWLLFKVFNEQPVFLSKPASLSEKDKDHICIKSRLLHQKVVNDFSERALGLATDYHQSVVIKSQTQKQFFYQVVKNLREKQNIERCTKKTCQKCGKIQRLMGNIFVSVYGVAKVKQFSCQKFRLPLVCCSLSC